MAQLSRPYQIGLATVAVLAAAWLVLLRPHSTSTNSGSSAPTPTTVAQSTAKSSPASKSAKHAKGSSSIYHGSAPGVQGLTRAVAKANGAVATSQQNAKHLEEKSTQASSATPPATTTSSSSSTTSTAAAKTPSSSSSSNSAAAARGAASRGAGVARQHAVEAQLAKGRTVVILFWDPKGADDESVHSAVRSLRSQHSLKIDIQEASASQVASFGTITRGLQVFGTPTLLIVGKKGQAKTLTGLQDAYAIAQTVREVQHGA